MNSRETKDLWKKRNVLFKLSSQKKHQIDLLRPSKIKIKKLETLNALKDSFSQVVQTYSELLKRDAKYLYGLYEVNPEKLS